MPSAFPLLGVRQEAGLARRSFRRPLRLDVVFDGFKGHLADGAGKVGPVPEIRFPIKRLQVVLVAAPDPSGRRRFEIINQGGDIQCGVESDQQMDMIFFPAEFDQVTSPPR